MEPLEIIQPPQIFSKEYFVDKYDDLCEKHFKIQKIVPLKKTWPKIILNVFLNIITVFTINYLYGFFNKLVKVMKYNECTLDEADLVGIYCNDGEFYFIELKKIDLPNVKNPDVITSQSNSSRTCYLFTFKLFTYIYNPNTNGFNSIKYNIYHTKEEIYSLMSKGLTDDEKQYQKYIYGDCDLFFHIDSFFRALFKNTCNFFFAFQIYSIILWNCTEYYAYAGLIAAMTLFDLLEETITNQSNLKSIRRMAQYSIPVKIYKKTSDPLNFVEEQSSNLVPGDVFELPEDGMAMPCDCILLSGSVIINEAMLTGESTPIIKSHLPNIKQNFDEENDAKYFLYAGTKIVQKRPENKKPVIALVFSTGFNTVKGNLIRSILYPVEMDSKFAQESVKFMIFMAIVCVLGFIGVLPVKLMRAETFADYKEICTQGLDLITTAVPPSLPCCLGVGIGIAQRRFKKKGIMCINRDKITSAGKIDICVFDKTGTLTEDHLNIAGFLPVEAHQKDETQININNNSQNLFIFDQYYDSVQALSKQNYEYYKEKIKNNEVITKKKELTQLYIECLACCQGITRVKDKIIGDPIDVEMFESTGWELIEEPEDITNYDSRIATYVRPREEKSLTEKLKGLAGFMQDPQNEEIQNRMKDHYELGIVRRFDFSSKLQRMSTLVKNLSQPNFTCYCKGSPEKIKELCQPKTIPQDFNEQLNNYTSRGFRVLAMGSKVIQMDFNKALEVNRTFCEKDLVFLGLLIVQNKLKDATNPTLRTLSHGAHIRVRMATGDNIMTAVCVGRKSNLIEPNAIVYSCEIETENENEPNMNQQNGDNIINTDNVPINKDFDIKSSRISMGVYENSLNIEKEKERKKRRLVWKTIESFNEEDIAGGEKPFNNGKFDGRTSFNNRLSCLVPQEVGEEDVKIEEEGNAMVKVIKEDKVLTEDEEDETLEIDLSTLPFKDEEEGDIEIAITGKTFETLYRLNLKYEKLKKQKNVVQQDEQLNNKRESKAASLIEYKDFLPEEQNKLNHFKSFHDAFRLVLKYCSIYARCSPDNKTQIVQSLQKESFTVLMCGDGANDCGALKVADVGISLSTEEASIAAPFTSRTPDISCVIEVLKEGKCALVTSLQTFKYILLYSLIQFTSVTLLILVDSYLSDWEFMASDLFLITPLAFLIPLAPAYHKLTYHKPVSSLFSFSIIFSMALQTLCVVAFQLVGEFLTDYYFPKNIFEELRECWGEFDNVVDRTKINQSANINVFNHMNEDGDDISENEVDGGEDNFFGEGETPGDEQPSEPTGDEDASEDGGEGEGEGEDEGEGEGEGEDEGEGEGEDEGEEEDEGEGEEEEEEEEEEEVMYQECIDNSTNFYISFSQYLILAVVFCTGKPFKKSIFYNYGMLIFSIIGFIYAEYIVFYVDYFSRRWIYITAYPDDPFLSGNFYELEEKALNSMKSIPFKYWVMILIVANFIMCLFIEKVIVPKCNKVWKRHRMKKLRQKLELDYDKEANLKLINNVKNYIKEQKKDKK